MDLYEKRLVIFEAALTRHLARFGTELDPSVHRFDLYQTRYKTGISNLTRKIKSKLNDELNLLVLTPRKPDTEADKTRFQDSIGLKPSIFGFSIDLRKLKEWWHGRKNT